MHLILFINYLLTILIYLFTHLHQHLILLYNAHILLKTSNCNKKQKSSSYHNRQKTAILAVKIIYFATSAPTFPKMQPCAHRHSLHYKTRISKMGPCLAVVSYAVKMTISIMRSCANITLKILKGLCITKPCSLLPK